MKPQPITLAAVLALVFADAASMTRGKLPSNQCLYSRVVFRESDHESVPAPDAGAAIVDADEGTALELAADGSRSIEIHFIGGPRWLDRIRIVTDAPRFAVEILDLERTWRPYVEGGEGIAGSPEGVTLAGPDVFVRGLRFAPLHKGNAEETIRLHEIEASFDIADPDKAGLGPAADGFNYHADWVNQYPGAGNDLSYCDNDVNDLGDDLPGDWDVWVHGNYDAWEEHFKRTDLGGTNSSHVDDADLSYFSGHGSSSSDVDGVARRTLMFGDDDNDDQHLTPGEASGAWDADMEWMGFSNCQTLKDPDADKWFHTMAGVHLICGWRTNAIDTDFGDDFGDYLIDDGWFDSAEKVKTSWFDAAEDTHGDGYTAVVIGETSDMGNDYLHGQGMVKADPTHNCCYTMWSYSTCGGIFCKPDGPPGTGPFDEPADVEAPPLIDPVRFESEEGLPVVIDRATLDLSAATSVPIFNVVPVMIDTPYVRSIANGICQQGGPFCGGDIGPGNPGHLNLIDGADELRVCQATGSMHYHDSGNWLEWRTSPPQLLSPPASISQAEAILNSLGRRRADAVVDRVEYVWQRGRNAPLTGMAQDIPESTFATATRVVYKRRLHSMPVAGPGGSMTVALGSGGQIQRLFEGAWRTVAPGPMVNVIPIQDAINHLAMHGSDGTVDGISPFVHQVQINSWELGYYEYRCKVPQTTIRPVYILNCTVTETAPGVTPPVTSPAKIHVWAEALPPVGTILSPPNGTCVAPGATICLNGSGSGGISPLTFEWNEDVEGLLGSGPSICAPLPAAPAGHPYSDSTRVVHLTVRDALGREGHAAVEICLTPSSGVPIDGGAGRPVIQAVLPNPTLGSIRVRFDVPRSGDYQVEIFDLAGRRIRSLPVQRLEPGAQTVEWNGSGENGDEVAAGIYFVRIAGPATSLGRQFAVVR